MDATRALQIIKDATPCVPRAAAGGPTSLTPQTVAPPNDRVRPATERSASPKWRHLGRSVAVRLFTRAHAAPHGTTCMTPLACVADPPAAIAPSQRFFRPHTGRIHNLDSQDHGMVQQNCAFRPCGRGRGTVHRVLSAVRTNSYLTAHPGPVGD